MCDVTKWAPSSSSSLVRMSESLGAVLLLLGAPTAAGRAALAVVSVYMLLALMLLSPIPASDTYNPL